MYVFSQQCYIFCAVFSDVKNIMLCGIESHVCVQSPVLYILCCIFRC